MPSELLSFSVLLVFGISSFLEFHRLSIFHLRCDVFQDQLLILGAQHRPHPHLAHNRSRLSGRNILRGRVAASAICLKPFLSFTRLARSLRTFRAAFDLLFLRLPLPLLLALRLARLRRRFHHAIETPEKQ